MMKLAYLVQFFLLSGLISSAKADTRAIMEGVPASANTILISTRTTRVGIRTTAPAANLDVTGVVNVRSLRITSPNTAGQSFGPLVTAGTNTSDEALNIQNAGGSSILFARGDGNVGIGTNLPGTLLDVVGVTQIGNSATKSTITITGAINLAANADLTTRGTGSIIGTSSITTTGSFFNPNYTSGSVLFVGTGGEFRQNNSNLFWDNTNNRLGIQTTTPGQPLVVKGGTPNLQGLFTTDGTNGLFLTGNGGSGTQNWNIGEEFLTNGLAFTPSTTNGGTTFSTPVMTLKSVSNNVGIGTIVPWSLSKLEVNNAVVGAVGDQNYWIRLAGGGGSTNQTQQIGMGFTSANSTSPVVIGARTVVQTGNTTAAFYVGTRSTTGAFDAPVEKLTVLDSGFVGINGQISPTQSLDVVGGVKISGSGSPATGGALCLNASNVMAKCTNAPDASGNCTCP